MSLLNYVKQFKICLNIISLQMTSRGSIWSSLGKGRITSCHVRNFDCLVGLNAELPTQANPRLRVPLIILNVKYFLGVTFCSPQRKVKNYWKSISFEYKAYVRKTFYFWPTSAASIFFFRNNEIILTWIWLGRH